MQNGSMQLRKSDGKEMEGGCKFVAKKSEEHNSADHSTT